MSPHAGWMRMWLVTVGASTAKEPSPQKAVAPALEANPKRSSSRPGFDESLPRGHGWARTPGGQMVPPRDGSPHGPAPQPTFQEDGRMCSTQRELSIGKLIARPGRGGWAVALPPTNDRGPGAWHPPFANPLHLGRGADRRPTGVRQGERPVSAGVRARRGVTQGKMLASGSRPRSISAKAPLAVPVPRRPGSGKFRTTESVGRAKEPCTIAPPTDTSSGLTP